MEQQKVLWIFFSVILGLLVISGAAILILSPDPAIAQPEGEIQQVSADPQTLADLRSGKPLPLEMNVEDPAEGEEEGFIATYMGVGDAQDTPEDSPIDQVDVEVRTTTETTPAIDTTTRTTSDVADKPEPESRTTTSTASTRSTTTASRTSTAGTASASSSSSASSTQTAPVTVHEYYIQAGSFRSRSTAEEAKDTLAEKGYTFRITTTEQNGVNYFRLRMGPYANKSEADDWLDKIKRINGFGGAYTSRVTVTR